MKSGYQTFSCSNHLLFLILSIFCMEICHTRHLFSFLSGNYGMEVVVFPRVISPDTKHSKHVLNRKTAHKIPFIKGIQVLFLYLSGHCFLRTSKNDTVLFKGYFNAWSLIPALYRADFIEKSYTITLWGIFKNNRSALVQPTIRTAALSLDFQESL